MSEVFTRPVLCVDIGGTSTKAGLLDTFGRLQFIQSIPSAPDVEAYTGRMLRLIQQVRDQAEASRQHASEMGLSVAGFLDENRTQLLYNSNLSWLERFPLKDRLCKAFPDLNIELEVDSNAATMAEYLLGSGRGFRRFLCATSGTGLGVGMAVDGTPLRFAYGCLGDMGHLIVQKDGPLCSCGGRGCAERMVSAPVLAERYRELTGRKERTTLRMVIDAAHAGDERAIGVLTEAGEWLGIALASMANTLFPDHIAIAGGLSAAGEVVLRPAERMFQQSASVAARSRTKLAQAVLGSHASLIGAASPFWPIQV